MTSLNYFLDRTDQTIESLQNLNFQSPGIFTNSIVKKPDIMKLLKDPSIDENSLYKINKINNESIAIDTRPERIDGKPKYVDQSFNEYITQQQEEDSKEKKTAVVLPKLVETREANTELNSSPTRSAQPKGIIFPDTNDLNELCHKVLSTIEKYPTLIKDYDALLNTLVNYKNRYNVLSKEINKLESDIYSQRQQLNYLNINYSDLNSPIKSGSELSQHSTHDANDEDDIDIDEFIRQEEEEIRQLEEKLNERQRLSAT